MRANQRQLYAVPNQRQAITRSQPMSIREFTGGDVKSDLGGILALGRLVASATQNSLAKSAI